MKLLMIIMLFLTVLFTNISYAENAPINIVINGTKVIFNEDSGYPFVDQNNRTLVPLNVTMKSFGAMIEWNNSLKIATVSRNGTHVKVPQSVNYIFVNDQKVLNDAASVIKNGRIYLPIKIVMESLGATVSWDTNNKQVTIIDNFSNNYFSDTLELSNRKYQGKVPGTLGYKLAAEYVENRFREYSVKPVIGSDLIYEYQTDFAELIYESVSINNIKFSIMKDYMPNGGCETTLLNKDCEFAFVKTGIESDYIDQNVDGKIVVFAYSDELGNFPAGVRDRIDLALKKGALGVFVIANDELLIGHYEHPLNNNSFNSLALYISPEMAKKIGVLDRSKIQTFSANCNIDIQTKRTPNIITQNIVGEIKGKKNDKTLVLVTNLDGFGKLPDGYVYENTTYSAITPALFISLAEYYSENQPPYNIVFAIVGDKWTSQKGIKDFVSNFKREEIVMIDFYSAGIRNKNTTIGYRSENDSDLIQYLSNRYVMGAMTDSGNALFTQFKNIYKNALFIRGDNSWYDQAKEDNSSLLDQKAMKEDINHYLNILESVFKYLNDDYVYQLNPKEVYISEADKKYLSLESKYFKVLLDQEFKEQVVNVNFLMEMDKIYERLAWYNYYPSIGVKPYAVFSQDTIAAAKLGQRKDIYENGHEVGGGFASFSSSTTDVIFCLSPELYTVSHELNHLFVGKTLKSTGVNSKTHSFNSESQGHTGIIYYSGLNYLLDIDKKVTRVFMSKEVMDVIEATRANTETKFEWGNITAQNNYFHQTTYHLYASMYDFIYSNYGINAMRRTIFRVYEAKTPEEEAQAMCYETGLNSDQFIKQWTDWMYSKGTNKVESELFILKRSNLPITDYDKRWNVNVSVLDKKYWTNYTQSEVIEKSNNTTIVQNTNQKMNTKGVNVRFDIPYNKTFVDVSNKYYKACIGIKSGKLVVQLDLSSVSESRFLTLFLQGDYPGLFYQFRTAGNVNTVSYEMDLDLARTFGAGIALNPEDRKFIFIDKTLVDKLIK